jgi:D-sedoheptulose 7-phosphate isomerase
MPFSPAQSLHDAHALAHQFATSDATLAFLHAAIDTTAQAFSRGNKLLAVGNGGSLCDASHIVEEFTGRFRGNRPPLPALACDSPGHLTCVANDFGFHDVFARWVAALAKPGDVVLLLSTSGNSENVLLAAKAAREAGAVTFALSGNGGGKLASLAHHTLVAPGATADRIQELHMLALHTLVEGVEHAMGFATTP